jgi:hypothetical protein
MHQPLACFMLVTCPGDEHRRRAEVGCEFSEEAQ